MKHTQGVIMTNKNAYEIRLDILHMANNNLWQTYHAQLEAAKQLFFQDKSLVNYANDVEKFKPTTEQIKDYAEELYKFVSDPKVKEKIK